jgi:DNA-binding response OmpR family regulator
MIPRRSIGKTAHVRSRIDRQMRQALMALYRVDLSYEIDLLRVESSTLSMNAKEARKLMILLDHREKRRPYVALLDECWKRQCADGRPLEAVVQA